MKLSRTPVPVLILALAAWLAPDAADAASVQRVLTGTVTMNTTSQTGTLSPAVDSTKSFIVCSDRTNNSNASNRPTCEINAAGDTVTITTSIANASQQVAWQVIEFDGGVLVKRGLQALAGGTGSVNVTLAPAVTMTKAFTIISQRLNNASALIDERWTVRARITAGNNLALTRNENTTDTVTVAWQVIEMDGASVQRGLASMGAAPANCTGGSSTTSCVVNITSVATANSFLLFTARAAAASNGIDGQYLARGALTSATQITFNRVGTSNTMNISWEVVTLDDGTTSQRNTQAFATGGGTDVANVGITNIDTNASIALVSASGGSNTGTADIDDTIFTAELTAGNNLLLDRNGGLTAASTVAWQVVTFFRCTAGSNVTFSSANGQDGQVVLNWAGSADVTILRWATTQGSETPFQGQVYTAGNTVGAATVVFSGTASTFTDTTVSNGTVYLYRVFARSAAGAATDCYASGAGSDTSADPTTAGSTKVWTYMVAGGSALKAPISGEGGTLYVSSNASRIISVATANGQESWSPAATTQPVQGNLVWTSLTAGGERVFGGDQSGRVYAVDVATGTTASPGWEAQLANADAIQAAVSIQIRAYSDSTFDAAYPGTYDVVLAATANTTGLSTINNKLVALRSDTGAVLWTANACPLAGPCPANVDQIIGQPWIDYYRNVVYVTSRAGAGAQSSLWAVSTLDGSLVTSFALGHITTAPTQSYDGNTLWVGNENGDVYAIDLTPATPVLKWTAPLALGAANRLKGFVWEDFGTAERLYFTQANGAVRCFADPGVGGTPDAATACAGWGATTVAVAGANTPLLNDQLYVGSFNGGSTGRIVPIDPATGATGTAFTVGDGTKTVGDLSSETGTELFVGTSEGKVFKISLPLP